MKLQTELLKASAEVIRKHSLRTRPWYAFRVRSQSRRRKRIQRRLRRLPLLTPKSHFIHKGSRNNINRRTRCEADGEITS